MKTVLFWIVFLNSFVVCGQTLALREVCTLPAILSETSGLETTGPNQFWTHTDSGGQPALYGFDTLGRITRTITLNNAVNIDWEDVTRDANGNLYLGDFGNNTNERKNLRIYKVPAPAAVKTNAVPAEIIQFSYPDQKAFPPAGNQKNFDMEAMIFYNDSLFLFSKNQTTPFNGYTKLYRLPAQPGNYTAVLVDSFYTGSDAIAGQITAAAISLDAKRLALLSYSKLFVFYNFTGSAFFNSQVTQWDMPSLTQKEAICFADNCTIYITDEEFLSTGRKLYQATICPVTTGSNDLWLDPELAIRALYPNPSFSEIVIQYHLPPSVQEAQLLTYNLYGQEVSRSLLTSSHQKLLLPVHEWTAGVYFCRIQTRSRISHTHKFTVAK